METPQVEYRRPDEFQRAEEAITNARRQLELSEPGAQGRAIAWLMTAVDELLAITRHRCTQEGGAGNGHA